MVVGAAEAEESSVIVKADAAGVEATPFISEPSDADVVKICVSVMVGVAEDTVDVEMSSEAVPVEVASEVVVPVSAALLKVIVKSEAVAVCAAATEKVEVKTEAVSVAVEDTDEAEAGESVEVKVTVTVTVEESPAFAPLLVLLLSSCPVTPPWTPAALNFFSAVP